MKKKILPSRDYIELIYSTKGGKVLRSLEIDYSDPHDAMIAFNAIPPGGYVEAVYLRYFNGIDSTILAEKSKLTSNRQIRMDSNDDD